MLAQKVNTLIRVFRFFPPALGRVLDRRSPGLIMLKADN
jgi:hypothetical protein